MRLDVVSNYAELSRLAAKMVTDVVLANPCASVVIATGNTPMGTYRELVTASERGELDCTRLRVFQLDEYLEVADEDARSLYGWMKRVFIDPLRIPTRQVVRLPGDSTDVERVCREYDVAVHTCGGLDLAVLGLGTNGHLAFNEPPSGPDAPTRMVHLAPESIESNGRYWTGRDEVPRRALTAGMATLLAARRILLLASGEHKTDILRRALRGPVTSDVPASYLQNAPDVVVIVDRAAAGQADQERPRPTFAD